MKNTLFVAATAWLVALVVSADNNFTTNLNMGANSITNVSSMFTSNITAYCYKDSKGNIITDFGTLTANIYPTLASNIAKGLDVQLSNWVIVVVADSLMNYTDAGIVGLSNLARAVAIGSTNYTDAGLVATGDFMRIQTRQATENVAITNLEGNTITTLIFTNGVYLGHK